MNQENKPNNKGDFSQLFRKQELTFIGWFAVVFLGTAALLAAFGLLPEELIEDTGGQTEAEVNNLGEHSALGILKAGGTYAGTNGTTTKGATSTVALVPDRLIIPRIEVDTVVKNPTSTDVDDLDAELKKGAVRYPGSGTLGSGNMFIFGHSTSHTIVQNKAYKVFNNIKTLVAGDAIFLQSGSKTYEYRVRDVTKVDKNHTMINFDPGANMLTLSTCNSFGAKTDRFVVQADFVGVR